MIIVKVLILDKMKVISVYLDFEVVSEELNSKQQAVAFKVRTSHGDC